MIRIVASRVLRPSLLEVTSNDGTRREADLAAELWGEVVEPLRDPDFFAQATVDPVIGTVVWPNEADFGPEFLSFGDERNPYEASHPAGRSPTTSATGTR